MRKYRLCGDQSKNELQFGRQLVAFVSVLHFLAQNVEVLQEIWIILDGCGLIRFYAMRRCLIKLCLWLLLRQRLGGEDFVFRCLLTHCDEKDLYDRSIFPCVRNYYLTCSYNPPAKKHRRNVDNQTEEN